MNSSAVDLVAVVGSCAPERHALAMSLAAGDGRWFIPAQRLAMTADPLEELVSLTRWASQPELIFAELPESVTVIDAIGALTASDSPVCLREILCVVDASHLIQDLLRDDYRPVAPIRRDPQEYMARAMLTATQIEFASTVCFVNWESLSTPDLSTMMALVSHLAPTARLRLYGVDTGQALIEMSGHGYSPEQDRPGWLRVLNGAFEPHMTDDRVSAFHYQRVGAFHPGRLQAVLDERVERGEFGQVLRSSGFCSFATRPDRLARWSHVGAMIDFDPVAFGNGVWSSDPDGAGPVAGISGEVDAARGSTSSSRSDADDCDFLASGQDIAFFGLDLEHEALAASLDTALLTDAEFTAGPDAWLQFPDPYPEWHVETHKRD